jgi:fatty acid/phospholipid biosynthesis enzyme
MKIGLDMMGGDFAPAEAVKGAVAFLTENKNDIEIKSVSFNEKNT